MRAKAAFVVGAGVGYVLGTRAGRQQYERIVRASRAVWSHPLVHTPISGLETKAAELARAQSVAMIDHLADAAKNLLRHEVVPVPGRMAPAATAPAASAPAETAGPREPSRAGQPLA